MGKTIALISEGEKQVNSLLSYCDIIEMEAIK